MLPIMPKGSIAKNSLRTTERDDGLSTHTLENFFARLKMVPKVCTATKFRMLNLRLKS